MKHGFIKAAAGSVRTAVADPISNAEEIKLRIQEADEAGVNLLVLPELAVTGCSCGCFCGCSCGCSEYDTTFTGPISGGCVSITNSPVPTVITIVSRKRFNRRRRGCRPGCGRSC